VEKAYLTKYAILPHIHEGCFYEQHLMERIARKTTERNKKER